MLIKCKNCRHYKKESYREYGVYPAVCDFPLPEWVMVSGASSGKFVDSELNKECSTFKGYAEDEVDENA